MIRCHWGVRAKLAYMAIHLPANVFHLYSVMVCSLEHKEVRCYKNSRSERDNFCRIWLCCSCSRAYRRDTRHQNTQIRHNMCVSDLPPCFGFYSQPTNQPTNQLTSQPTNQPSNQASKQPSNQASNQQTNQPTTTKTHTFLFPRCVVLFFFLFASVAR